MLKMSAFSFDTHPGPFHNGTCKATNSDTGPCEAIKNATNYVFTVSTLRSKTRLHLPPPMEYTRRGGGGWGPVIAVANPSNTRWQGKCWFRCCAACRLICVSAASCWKYIPARVLGDASSNRPGSSYSKNSTYMHFPAVPRRWIVR
jgi:hypothetical protein